MAGNEKKCIVCGKTYSGYNTFDYGTRYFCRWTCRRKWETDSKGKRNKLNNQQITEIRTRFSKGEKAQTIAAALGLPPATVAYYDRKVGA